MPHETSQSNRSALRSLPRPEGEPPAGAWTVTPEGGPAVPVWRAFAPPPVKHAGQNAHGYGRKIALDHAVYFNGRWRRVYCCCFSNSGTAYLAQRTKVFGPIVHGFQDSPGLLR